MDDVTKGVTTLDDTIGTVETAHAVDSADAVDTVDSFDKTVIAVRDLQILSGTKRLVGPVTFELSAGSTTGLCGPSGAGKSTVLRALVDLLPHGLRRQGEVEVLGRPVRYGKGDSGLRSTVVLVPQTPVVFGGSILDNALFGLRHLVRASRTEMHDRVEQALREAGLWSEVSHRLDTPAQTLSNGQRQRLCLARALALEPAALLLDEPTSALDERSRDTVEESVAALRGNRTVLLVSHDPAQVERLCDRTIRVDLPTATEPSLAAV